MSKKRRAKHGVRLRILGMIAGVPKARSDHGLLWYEVVTKSVAWTFLDGYIARILREMKEDRSRTVPVLFCGGGVRVRNLLLTYVNQKRLDI